jgi:hypothetical protein
MSEERLRRRPKRAGVYVATAVGCMALGLAALGVLFALPHP